MGEIRESAEDGDQKGSIGGEEVGKYFESMVGVLGCCTEDFGDVRDGLMGIELNEVKKGSSESGMSGTKVEGKFVKDFGCV